VNGSSIPLGDAWSLGAVGNRTRTIRAAFVVALLGAAVAAFFFARTTNSKATPLLPPGSSGVVVLDQYTSVEHGTQDRK